MRSIHTISASIFALALQASRIIARFAGFKVINAGVCASIAPVIGFFAGLESAALVYVLRTAFHFIGTPTFISCTTYLPTFMGTVYLSSRSKLLKASIPFVCGLLFIAHPVGSASWLYTLHWILPFLLSFFTSRSRFLQALACSYATHAVGSVLWIYTHQTTPGYWHALLSIVWAERLVATLLLTGAYYALLNFKQLLQRWRTSGLRLTVRGTSCQSR